MSQTVTITTVPLSPEQVKAMIVEAIIAARPQERPLGRKKLLTGKEVQEEYGIHARNLEVWRCRGVGPAYTTMGRRIYYERDVLDAFIRAGRVQTTGEAD